jgi:hypothetical protein
VKALPEVLEWRFDTASCMPPPLLELGVNGVSGHEGEGGDEGVLVPPAPPAMKMRFGPGSDLGSASTSTSPTTEPILSGFGSVPVSLGLGYHLFPQRR